MLGLETSRQCPVTPLIRSCEVGHQTHWIRIIQGLRPAAQLSATTEKLKRLWAKFSCGPQSSEVVYYRDALAAARYAGFADTDADDCGAAGGVVVHWDAGRNRARMGEQGIWAAQFRLYFRAGDVERASARGAGGGGVCGRAAVDRGVGRAESASGEADGADYVHGGAAGVCCGLPGGRRTRIHAGSVGNRYYDVAGVEAGAAQVCGRADAGGNSQRGVARTAGVCNLSDHTESFCGSLATGEPPDGVGDSDRDRGHRICELRAVEAVWDARNLREWISGRAGEQHGGSGGIGEAAGSRQRVTGCSDRRTAADYRGDVRAQFDYRGNFFARGAGRGRRAADCYGHWRARAGAAITGTRRRYGIRDSSGVAGFTDARTEFCGAVFGDSSAVDAGRAALGQIWLSGDQLAGRPGKQRQYYRSRREHGVKRAIAARTGGDGSSARVHCERADQSADRGARS